MKIAFLTTDDPIYLPSFFERVLSIRADDSAVFVVPPRYKNQTPLRLRGVTCERSGCAPQAD